MEEAVTLNADALRNWPDEPLRDFAVALADRLNPKLLPVGFNLACELFLYDLQSGGSVDGFGRPMPRALTGQPAVYYAVLRMSIPRLARAAGGDDFEAAVAAVQAEVRQKLNGDAQ